MLANLPSHLKQRWIRLHGEAAPQALPVLQAAGNDQPAILPTGSSTCSCRVRGRDCRALAAVAIRRRDRWQGKAVGATLRHKGHKRLAAALRARIRPVEGSSTASV